MAFRDQTVSFLSFTTKPNRVDNRPWRVEWDMGRGESHVIEGGNMGSWGDAHQFADWGPLGWSWVGLTSSQHFWIQPQKQEHFGFLHPVNIFNSNHIVDCSNVKKKQNSQTIDYLLLFCLNYSSTKSSILKIFEPDFEPGLELGFGTGDYRVPASSTTQQCFFIWFRYQSDFRNISLDR